MLYMTIVLELLHANPQLHQELRQTNQLVPALHQYENQLKTSHQQFQERVMQQHPEMSPTQVTSAALEIAVAELEMILLPSPSPDGSAPETLYAAMAFLRKHTPPA